MDIDWRMNDACITTVVSFDARLAREAVREEVIGSIGGKSIPGAQAVKDEWKDPTKETRLW